MSRILLLFSLIALLTGCGEPQADVTTTKTHSAGGTTFDYPDNWKITDEIINPAIHTLFVETPGEAIVIYQSYPVEDADEFKDYIRSFSQNAADGMPSGMKLTVLKISDITEKDGYQWATEDFKIDILSESVPHQRIYAMKEINGKRVFLIFQVANEDVDKTEAGFKLIQDTLRSADSAE